MTDAQIEIRIANVTDIKFIAAMVERYWGFEGIAGFDHAEVARQLSRVVTDHRLGRVIIGGDGEKLIGYLVTVYMFSLEHLGLTAEIDEFYVEPEYRSRGVGSSLLSAAERAASDAGCTNLSLQLSDGNQGAREMDLRHGFSPRSGYALLEKDLRGG
jgi:GNAT superfamily N-acetyltransferase